MLCALLLEFCNKVLIGPLNPRYRCNLLFLLRYQNFRYLVCALKLAQFVVLIIDTVWACASGPIVDLYQPVLTSEPHLRPQMWNQDCHVLGCACASYENRCRLSFSLLALSQLLFNTFFVAAVSISTYIEHSFTKKDKQGRTPLPAV